MRTFVTLTALAIGGALGAWSADVVVDGALLFLRAEAPRGTTRRWS